jgi:predicted restriction endonuclease
MVFQHVARSNLQAFFCGGNIRGKILKAYDYSCAVCVFNVRTTHALVGVEATSIHDLVPDLPRKGSDPKLGHGRTVEIPE